MVFKFKSKFAKTLIFCFYLVLITSVQISICEDILEEGRMYALIMAMLGTLFMFMVPFVMQDYAFQLSSERKVLQTRVDMAVLKNQSNYTRGFNDAVKRHRNIMNYINEHYELKPIKDSLYNDPPDFLFDEKKD